MINQLSTLSLRFDNLPLKTRLISIFVLLLLLFALFDSIFLSGQNKQIRQFENQRTQNHSTIEQLHQTLQQLNSNYAQQKNNPTQIRLNQVLSELEAIKSDLQSKTINLLSPEMMASMIESIFSHQSNLKLMSLSKIPPVIMATGENNTQLKLYKHPIKLVFQGDYQGTIDLLLYLESTQNQFHFDTLEYQVDQHPDSTITLELSTLSLKKEWIGG